MINTVTRDYVYVQIVMFEPICSDRHCAHRGRRPAALDRDRVHAASLRLSPGHHRRRSAAVHLPLCAARTAPQGAVRSVPAGLSAGAGGRAGRAAVRAAALAEPESGAAAGRRTDW